MNSASPKMMYLILWLFSAMFQRHFCLLDQYTWSFFGLGYYLLEWVYKRNFKHSIFCSRHLKLHLTLFLYQLLQYINLLRYIIHWIIISSLFFMLTSFLLLYKTMITWLVIITRILLFFSCFMDTTLKSPNRTYILFCLVYAWAHRTTDSDWKKIHYHAG